MDRFLAGRRGHMIALLVLLAVGAGYRYLFVAESSPGVLTIVGTTMGTTYSIKVIPDKKGEATQSHLKGLIDARLEKANRLFSAYREDSDVSRLNQAAIHQEVSLRLETMNVLLRARDIHRLTGGAFDVTVGPLVRLWGFWDKHGRRTLPSATEVAEVRSQVGMDKLLLDIERRTGRKEVHGLDVNLSAIAKGRGVDMVAEALLVAGQRRFMIEVGGEVRCRGTNQQGIPWRIGIERPASNDLRQVLAVVRLKDRALATSGDYRSFYKVDDERFSHTIDPKTGRPVAHSLASVSVVANDCMTADALATGLMVMGKEAGMALAVQENLAVLFVERTDANAFTVEVSPMFESLQGREATR